MTILQQQLDNLSRYETKREYLTGLMQAVSEMIAKLEDDVQATARHDEIEELHKQIDGYRRNKSMIIARLDELDEQDDMAAVGMAHSYGLSD